MLLFESVADFARVLSGTRKWARTLEAIANVPHVADDVAYSIGDSLTYRVTTRPDHVELTGHRRYLAVRHVVSGRSVVEVAPVADLTATDEYSDLTDRRHFAGAGEVVELPKGSVLIADIDEALRDVEVTGRVLTLRVTVEGAFFANK